MNYSQSTLLLLIVLLGCSKNTPAPESINYRQEMRNFVQEISNYAHKSNSSFVVIPQNGIELISENGEADGSLNADYLAAINGVGQEDLFYGYNNDDEATPVADRTYLTDFLKRLVDEQKKVLVTDYCSTPLKIDDSYAQNRTSQFVSFAAPSRELDVVPTYPAMPAEVNQNNITNLSQARNFLYLINPASFTDVNSYLAALQATDYDVLLIDAFFKNNILTPNQVNSLKQKTNGGTRLVIAYMSIGEAEDYRYYWQADWKTGNPDFLKTVNPDWPGNYKVAYWDNAWKSVIYGNENAYLDKLLAAGFDGAYLDIIEGFEYFESLQ